MGQGIVVCQSVRLLARAVTYEDTIVIKFASHDELEAACCGRDFDFGYQRVKGEGRRVRKTAGGLGCSVRVKGSVEADSTPSRKLATHHQGEI